ncbi:hypothetical protein GLOIN_2v1880126 [Rhizophagus irregularis DAOM 181602=DAOM 197198]|nr:hypothetical protein GLOIN_2v1880126 [Rhizophagus irregularis DAOM 181602=DAOM 197198]
MAKHLEVPVTLLTPGTINENLHYGPFARYWWSSRSTNGSNEHIFFPIRLGQKTRVFRNNREFIVSVVLGNSEHPRQPGYFCSSGSFSGKIETSPTRAISSLYNEIFHNSTKFSGPTIIGQDNPKIIEEISRGVRFIPFQITIDKYKIFIHDLGVSSHPEWHNAGSGYSSSLLHFYNKKQALFVSRIVDNECIIEIYQQAQKIKIIRGSTPSEVWRKSWFMKKYDGSELYGLKDQKTQNSLRVHHVPTCTPSNWGNLSLMSKLFEYHLKRRTISKINWYTIFDIWGKQDSDIFELYSNLKKIYPKRHKFGDRELRAWRALLKAAGAHLITPFNSDESKFQFWTRASNPIKDSDTISNLYKMGFLVSTPIHMPNSTKKFWYCFDRAIKENKKTHDGKRRVGSHTIIDAKRHSRLCGYGCPPMLKPVTHRMRLSQEKLDQFDSFFSDKNNVNMSSYKTDNESGLPILYLQNNKKSLWEKFTELYPNGMGRTSFMTRLESGRFVYKENLGGLCSICNENFYEVFLDLEKLIENNIVNTQLKILRRYLRKDFEKELKVDITGKPKHNPCICHCLIHAFGICSESHTDACSQCNKLFFIFELLKKQLSAEHHEFLNIKLKQLIFWLSHLMRKFYLNSQFNIRLQELDDEGAVLIVDYKMRILPQTSRETKSEFFGKRGWTLHSVLVYQKIKENLEQKPKWITIISDNGPHYHNTQLMIILSYWYDWYNVEVRRWIFLEAGEAKTSIDSHHAQISQAIKRYVRLGLNITDGEDIQKAIQNISGARVSQLTPDREFDKKTKIGTIAGINNWNEWSWPVDGPNAGHILARALPHINEWTTITPAKIKKLEKTPTTKPNPSFTTPSKATNQWVTPILRPISSEINNIQNNNQKINTIIISSVDLDLVDLTNKENTQQNTIRGIFFAGWALKEKQIINQRGTVKRIKPEIKALMETMFLNGNIDKRKKMSAQEMYDNLTERASQEEIEENDIPKVQTIQNWIANYTRTFKASASLRALEEAESSKNT